MDDIEQALAIVNAQSTKIGQIGQTPQQPKEMPNAVKSVNLDNYTAKGAQTSDAIDDQDIEYLYEEQPHDYDETGDKTTNNDASGGTSGMSYMSSSILATKSASAEMEGKEKSQSVGLLADAWNGNKHQKLMHQMATMKQWKIKENHNWFLSN